MFKKTRRGRVLPVLLLLITGYQGKAQSQCFKVDLQAVSVNAGNNTVKTGEQLQVVVAMKNNGPCPIPIGHATTQITISAVYLDLAVPFGFRDVCGQWSFVTAVSNATQHNLFFRNNQAEIPAGVACSFSFSVTGKNTTASPSPITLASSLSANATTADMNGNNQSASVEVSVTGMPLPEVVSDFKGAADNCNAVLSWKASSESKVDSFIVEYGITETEFTKGVVAAPRKTDAVSKYEFKNDQGTGRSYYRVKIFHGDGRVSYSKTLSVDTKCPVKKGFTP